jgi:hypothetical protein
MSSSDALIRELERTRDETLAYQSGLRTVKDEFDQVASHTERHLRQIRQALAGRTAG